MGDRIESGCDRQFDGEGQREVDVVENDLRQYSGRTLRRFSSLDGLAEDRGRLGSGVGRGYHDLRQVGPKSNRLAEPGRRSASDRDETVGLDRVGIGNRAVRHFDGRMHRRVREGSRGAVRRSDEHTSELQSLMRISYAVFCLKKKITKYRL